MIRRQEKFRAPPAEQEPQRLLVSRTVMLLAAGPGWVAPGRVVQWLMGWGAALGGARGPASNSTRWGTRAMRVAIQWPWLSAKRWAKPTSVRSGMVSTTSPVALETRRVIRLAVGRRFRATLKAWPWCKTRKWGGSA